MTDMNRIEARMNACSKKQEKAFITYVTAGLPDLAATKEIIRAQERGAKRDIVLLNTGATLYVGGVAESMEAGVKLAAEAIDSGAAARKLKELVRVSNT